MKDIELPPLPESCQNGNQTTDYFGKLFEYTRQDMRSYARAAVEADRAQRVPDVAEIRRVLACVKSSVDSGIPVTDGWRILDALLASTPAQTAQQEPDCQRCNGSGEDPEGYFDQSRGPDGDTHDGPCRDCAGTGAAPQPVERKPMTDAEIEDLCGEANRGFCIELEDYKKAVQDTERHHGIRE